MKIKFRLLLCALPISGVMTQSGKVFAQNANISRISGDSKTTHLQPLTAISPDYKLAYEENFNNNSLNTADWYYRHIARKHAGGFNRRENVSVVTADGIGYLNIAYKKDKDYDGDGVPDLSGGGVISTKTFGYGYYEARIKFYKGSKGLHESFWTHGLGVSTNETGDTVYNEAAKRDRLPMNNVTTEIDAIELDSYISYGKTNFWFNKKPCDCPAESSAAAFNRFDSSYMNLDEWINVGFEWLPGMIKYYIDGVERYRYSYTTPAYAAMEVWLSALANTLWFKGEPLPDASMKVDYFRYYNKPLYANLIGNYSFEFDGKPSESVNNWIVYDGIYNNEQTDGSRVVYDGTAFEGKGYLQQDGKSTVPYISTSYGMSYIPNGSYKLTAWVKRSRGMKKATMSASNTGAAEIAVNIPPADTWTKITLDNIIVTSNSALVGFTTSGADGEWLKVDNVELYDKSMPNPNKAFPILLQELEPGYSESGTWRGSVNFSPKEGGIWGNAIKGYNGSSVRFSKSSPDIYAQWQPRIPATGSYDVYIYKPVAKDADNNARIEIKHADGIATKYLDYAVGKPGWVLLGTYKLNQGATTCIRNYSNTPGRNTIADAIAITLPGTPLLLP